MSFRGIQPSTTFSLELLDRFGLSRSGPCKPRSDEARMLLFHPCGFISLHLCDKKQGDESHHHTHCCRVADCPAHVGNLEESSTLKLILRARNTSGRVIPQLHRARAFHAAACASSRRHPRTSRLLRNSGGFLRPSANLHPDFVTSFAINDLR